ncbi:MAG: alpha-galactosidase, partial [Planctomycetota bacterium]
MSSKHVALLAAVLSLSCATKVVAPAGPDSSAPEARPEWAEAPTAAAPEAATAEVAKPEGASITNLDKDSYVIENAHLGRELSIEGGVLRTTAIVNKRAGTRAVPTSCDEFRLRVSDGTHTTGTDVTLTSADFRVERADAYEPEADAHALESQTPAQGLAFVLRNAERGLTVEVRYEIAPDDFYMRKRLVVTSAKPVTLERIDVDSVAFDDAEQPYTIKAIYARGKWSPGLGQPLYTSETATFWGVEFPAADNHVEGQADLKTLRCGYLWGREIAAGAPYTSYPSVTGVSDDPAFNTDAFFDYIARIRVRPLRLQIQYNTWFDTGRGVNKDRFRASVELIHNKLAVERGTKPLRAYVIDDGWQDTSADWTDKTWKVNSKFDPDFATSRETVGAARSTLGIWLSPGCLFGASRMVKKYREAGFEALDDWMSLAGP